jgi:hypothetical protein
MRDLIKKAGSLVLGVGALSLALVHAAATHGCASSAPPTQAPDSHPTAPPAAANATPVGAHPDCTPPDYMYATKAPILLPPHCRGEPASPPPQAPPGAKETQQAP